MKKLTVKLLILLIIVSVPQIIISRTFLKRIDIGNENPRQSIFTKKMTYNYRYALLGDSVFCSYYVDNEAQTLWRQIENRTGQRVFPGALDGARPCDLIKIAVYLGEVLTPDTVVFVDAFPGKNWEDSSQFHKNQLTDLIGDYDYNWDKIPLSNAYLYLLVNKYRYKVTIEDLKSIYKYLANKPVNINEYFMTGYYYNRVWNHDGSFALTRYKQFENISTHKLTSCEFSKLGMIAEVLRRAKLRPVIVLTPLNTELIKQYSASDSSKVIGRFSKYRESIRSYLENKNIIFLDLTDLVPSEGFADLVHTNAFGDALISRKLADFINIQKAKY